MSLQLVIPESIAGAIRLPEARLHQGLLAELALALYGQHLLSFGKAHELSGMNRYDFGRLLGERGIARHYGQEELADDEAYARSE